MKAKDDYFNKVINEYEERRNLLVSELNKIEGVNCPNPKGAFYCIAELPIDDSNKFCKWILEKYSLDNQTVMMAPASGFYTKLDSGKKQVRIAYVLNKDKIIKATKIIKEALKQYKN